MNNETTTTEAAAPKQSVLILKEKGVFAALALVFLFGPLGNFYTGMTTGIISCVVFLLALILGFLTAGVGLVVLLPIAYIVAIILAVVYTKKHNTALMNR